MKKITDITEIHQIITDIKIQHQGFISNFYLSQDKQELYIKEKLLFVVKYEKTIFLFLLLHDYYKLYFFSASYEDLQNDIKKIDVMDKIIVCELMGRHSLDKEQMILENAGFTYYSRLIQMYKKMQASKRNIKFPPNIVYAEKEDVDEIWQLLLDNFNKYVDINIIKKELENYIKDKHVIITKEHGKIVAFCVYFINKGKGEGRYLYIDKNYKDTVLGALYTSIMLSLVNQAQYQSGFVREDNKYLLDFDLKLGYKYGQVNDIIYYKAFNGVSIEPIKPMN